jgi:hypothetical protein
MALETGTYISDLVITNPLGTDQKSTADDHLRLIKSTIKSTFPNINSAVNPTPAQMNFLVGVTSAIQPQMDTKAAKGANTDITSITGNAATASAVAWSGITSKPTTVAGYSISDMGSQSVNFATTATTATNLAAGVAGAVHYQTGAGASGFSASGTSGQVLTSNGTTAPTWVAQSALTVGNATTAAACSGNAATATNATNAATAAAVTSLGTNSIGTNGYQRLPGGLIMQWGFSASWAAVTFPLTFPTNCFSVTSTATGNHEHSVNTVTATGFSPGTNGSTSSFYWMAFGN